MRIFQFRAGGFEFALGHKVLDSPPSPPIDVGSWTVCKEGVKLRGTVAQLVTGLPVEIHEYALRTQANNRKRGTAFFVGFLARQTLRNPAGRQL